LDWTGFCAQAMRKQKTGRNCLGPVADFTGWQLAMAMETRDDLQRDFFMIALP
jgi:hypothetical protein